MSHEERDKVLKYGENDAFKIWINSRTKDDEFSPLHFASFSGNLDAIDTLVHHYADIHQRTRTKMTMMHVAAQSD